MRRLFLLFLAFFLITTLCGCVRTGYYNGTVANIAKPTLTPTMPTIKNRPASTVEPKAIPTPTPTPIHNSYVFKSNTGEIDLSTGQITINFSDGALKNIKVVANLISPENLGKFNFNSTSEGLQLEDIVETGTSVIRPDIYGNLLIGCHSGYYDDKPLNCEELRHYVEKWGKEDEQHIEEKLSKMVGSTGILSTGNISLDVKVLGGVRLDNPEMLEVNSKPEEVVDIVTKKKDGNYVALGNAEIFEGLKEDGHEILVNFCGWGPNENYTHYRYVILLEVKENE